MNRRSCVIVLVFMLVGANAYAQKATPLTNINLTAQRDSFFVMVNGRAVGVSVSSTTATPTGFLIKEATAIGKMGGQIAEVETDKAGHPLKVGLNGKINGQPMSVNINYAAGRAKGGVKMPGAPTAAINAAVPANVIDDNMIQAIMPNLPLSLDTNLEVPIFLAGGNKLVMHTIVVTDEITVSIPSGQHKAFRIELRGGEEPAAFYVSQSKPHKILKIVPANAPFEFVRAN
ncbi:MAG TPA: hypothetical protein VM100_10060 [Longimicrobiales bacterium]|nr:hypothetical protein [Longimicrobiales bacterium]